MFTLPWEPDAPADLEVTITPPGERRGDGHLGRAGSAFVQDADNYLTISEWNDDLFGGSSISSFLRHHGDEDIYRAVWTNVGNRVAPGRTHRLRATFDGKRYWVFIDDEPVLYRALSDVDPSCEAFAIRHVGLVVNWEFGDDTGSVFRRFVAFRGDRA